MYINIYTYIHTYIYIHKYNIHIIYVSYNSVFGFTHRYTIHCCSVEHIPLVNCWWRWRPAASCPAWGLQWLPCGVARCRWGGDRLLGFFLTHDNGKSTGDEWEMDGKWMGNEWEMNGIDSAKLDIEGLKMCQRQRFGRQPWFSDGFSEMWFSSHYLWRRLDCLSKKHIVRGTATPQKTNTNY